MKILVKTKLFSREEKIEKIPQDGFDFLNDKNNKLESYTVWVKEKPEDGKANEAIIKILSKYFNTSKSNIILVSGQTNRDKIFNINI